MDQHLHTERNYTHAQNVHTRPIRNPPDFYESWHRDIPLYNQATSIDNIKTEIPRDSLAKATYLDNKEKLYTADLHLSHHKMNGHENAAYNGGGSVNIQMTRPRGSSLKESQNTGSVLSAHNINYTVKVPGKCCRGGGPKQILHDITGIFKPGLNAILGPTGSGKSSFLDVLAGRKEQNGLSGTLLLDGQPVPENFKCMVGYVVQDDVVMGTLSVKENLSFSAALRLPTSVSREERNERVDQVIRDLGLVKCADTKVGNQFIRGVSGGERKRCNIGMELIISPPVLFLDEPTTGLDANTANTVLLFLKRLSQNGRTIIFSIHQPRYSIYRLFDGMMLLSAGYTIYHGPAHEALTFFSDLGFVCQEHNNPPDFFLDVINGDPSVLSPGVDLETEISTGQGEDQSQHNKLVDGYKKSKYYSSTYSEADQIMASYNSKGGEKGLKKVVDYATPFYHQVLVVAGRSLKNIIRNPQTSILSVVVSLVFALIIAAIYWQLDEDPESGFKDRGGVLFFLIMNQLFINMSAVEIFIYERAIFIHENSSGFYRVSVYFLVKVFFDLIPLRIVPLLLTGVIVYFSVGLNPGADHFFLFLLTLLCVSLAATSLCFLLSSTVKVFAVAQLLLALCYVLMMLLGGFLINLDSIGVIVNWAQYLSLFKYGLAGLYINEFKGRAFGNCTVELPPDCKTGEQHLEQNDIDFEDEWDFWKNIVAMAIYGSILFTLSYVQLRRLKKE